MKKLLMALLIPVLLLPMVVFADMEVLHSYYNDNVMENGEVKVTVPVSYDKEYNWVITYDTKYLKTDPSMITISPDQSSKIVNDEPVLVGNKKEVKISNGKITIKAKMDHQEGLIDDDSVAQMIFRFTAIQKGETTIKIESQDHDFIMSPTIKITANPSNTVQEPIVEPTEEKEEEKEEKPKEEVKEEKKDDRKTKDLIFYISLGLNALLLIAVIILVIKGKKKAPVEEAKEEPVEEPKQE